MEWSNETFYIENYKGYISKDGKSCYLNEMIVPDSMKEVVIPSEINGMKVTKLERKKNDHISYMNLFSDDFDELIYDDNKSKIGIIIISDTVIEISDQVFCLLPKFKK